jgi:hypothetical protein
MLGAAFLMYWFANSLGLPRYVVLPLSFVWVALAIAEFIRN